MKEDWINCNFEDILTLKNGFAFKSDKYSENGTPVIRISDINNAIVKTTNAKKVQDEENYENYLVEFGDILIAMSGATTGKFGIYKEQNKAYQNQRVGNFKLHCEELINKNYIYYLLYALRRQIEKDAYGGAQPNISSKKIEAMQITLAPLLEQKAIVAKIEQLFSELDNAVTNLKTAQAKLKIYRQAVLKKAFDLNNKSYLLEEISEEIFAGGDKPKDYFSEEQTDELQVPIYANAVANRGLYGYTKEPRVIKQAITVAGRGSGTGHIELRNEPFVPIVRLITIVPNLTIVDLYYLMYFLKNLNIQKSGSAIPQLTIPMIKEYRIHLPSMTMQKQIVQEIESKLSVCDKIEETIETSLVKSEALRQSILKKAFEGKLLSEKELENIKNHPEYESAEELLTRIKKERDK